MKEKELRIRCHFFLNKIKFSSNLIYNLNFCSNVVLMLSVNIGEHREDMLNFTEELGEFMGYSLSLEALEMLI